MFEHLLARKYILTQKRHSVLTVCSIAIALALMVMMFTCFSTLISCLRSVALDSNPYHITIANISKEQGIAISKEVGDDGSCKVRQIGQDEFAALIYFDKYIDDAGVYLGKLLRSAGLTEKTANFNVNGYLMMLDMIDLSSRASMVQYFAMFYVFVIFVAITLRLIIDTAFEVSSKERERQFGVLQSIGATPSQIVRIITFEGLLLSVIGIPIGTACGIGLAYAAFQAVIGSGLAEAFFTPEKAAELLHFHVSPLLTVIAAVTGLVWVLLSAYGTGMRIIRMSPMQAISNRSNTVKKVRKRSLSGLVFGWTGKLASRNNRRQPKRFLITVISLTLSIALFASFSVVIERMEAVLQEQFNYEGEEWDLALTFIGDENDPLSYREPLQEIKDCGYFKDIDYYVWKFGRFEAENPENNVQFGVQYLDEWSYNHLYNGNPPLSYDELNSLGGYMLMVQEGRYVPEQFRGMDSVPLLFKNISMITAEEYEALTEEEQANVKTWSDGSYTLVKEITTDFPIGYVAEFPGFYDGWSRDYVFLVGTLDMFENGEYERYGDKFGVNQYVECHLADEEQYRETLRYVEDSPILQVDIDFYAARQRLQAAFASFRIGLTFLNLIVALIALVNMVNILSTSILNRRNELAAMQCIGMTERQLYRMTTVECLQYTLGAGIMALVLCGIIIMGTEAFLDSVEVTEMEDMLSYTSMLPRVGIAMVVSFIAALLASLIPLRGMQKTSLVEQLRQVD